MQSADLINIYKRLWNYTKPYRKFLGMAILGMAVYAITNTALVAFLKPLMDENLFQQNIAEFSFLGTALIIMAILILRGISNFLSVYYVGYVGNWVVKDLRSNMMKHLLNLPALYFDTQEHGTILSRFTYDCEQVAALSSKALLYVVRDTLTIIAIVGWMFYLNFLLCLMLLLIAIPIFYVMRAASRRFRKFARQTQQLYGYISSNIQRVIATNLTVKSSNAQPYEYQAFEKNNDQLRRKKMRTIQTRALNVPLVMILAGSSLIVIIYFSKADAVFSNMSLGSIVSFMAAVIILFSPLRRIALLNSILQQGVAAAENIFRFIDEPLEKDTGTKTITSLKGAICFKNVFLRYPNAENDVLHDINLDISAGETVALVGHSGVGKTSLMNLLPRLYETTQGSIEIDGQDIRSFSLHELRNQISYVGQNPVLIHGTVTENIAYGTQASAAAVEEAAVQAHAIEFIKKLPQGFDTIISNYLLSGGQIQRIAIARALLRTAPILIFDEVTSSLDSVSEKQIKNALQENRNARTMIIIAHRFSTIDFVEKNVVLDRGRIVAIGKHELLLDKCPLYHELYTNQTPHALIQ